MGGELVRLARGCRSDAILVTDTVDPTVGNDASDLAYLDRNLHRIANDDAPVSTSSVRNCT